MTTTKHQPKVQRVWNFWRDESERPLHYMPEQAAERAAFIERVFPERVRHGSVPGVYRVDGGTITAVRGGVIYNGVQRAFDTDRPWVTESMPPA